MAALFLSSCSEESLDDQSVIVESETTATQFDKWLEFNYRAPYNIRVMYRYEDTETDMNYYAVPADYDQAVELAHIVKYSCIEAYDEIAGVDFTREYFPKLLYFSGEWEYRNNGTIVLGTAEGGKKIFLAGVNYLDQYKQSISLLNHYYLKTIHHEFTHILNQTKDYPTSYQQITGSDYVADSWNESPFSDESYYLTHGFISAYSQYSDSEDFAEMLSVYVTNTAETWNEFLTAAGKTGAALINAKLEIVKNYMSETWGIDLDKLRDAVIGREEEIAAGRINLTDLTIDN